jgi:hypothetical protein
MKVELGISIATNVATASKCPEVSELFCGINYRSAF